MKDHELDRWLQDSNARLVRELRADIDIETRRRLVLGEKLFTATTNQIVPNDDIARTPRLRRPGNILALLAAAACALVTVVSMISTAQSDRDVATIPSASLSPGQKPNSTVPPIDLSHYQRIVGPVAMRTVIPVGWLVTSNMIPDTFEASEPNNPASFLRYGCAQSASLDLFGVHADHESQFASNRSGYQRIRLEQATLDGMAAVAWEFEYDSEEAGETERRHVSVLYWLDDGYEYFLYASAPTSQWAEMASVFTTMIEHTDS